MQIHVVINYPSSVCLATKELSKLKSVYVRIHGHRSVGLDLRTEKSGFFAIWTGFGLDLTSFTGLWISAFGMDCKSNPSHPTLKQEDFCKVIWK